LNFELAISLLS